jgi:hypothetical protein
MTLAARSAIWRPSQLEQKPRSLEQNGTSRSNGP